MKRNKIEVRVCGLQRSGNHAIIDWIMGQFVDQKVCFLNNVLHGNHDPFLTASQIFTYKLDGFLDGRLETKNLNESQRREVREKLKLTEKDVVIYSYEDDLSKIGNLNSFLESVYCQDFEAQREIYMGRSACFYDVIIVRDPYNFFASRLKRLHERTGIKDVDKILLFWKEIAREAESAKQFEDSGKIVISYNDWFSNKIYRKQLCKKIDGYFSDSSLKQVSVMGKGSSFDRKKFNRNLTVADIFSKWHKLLRIRTIDEVNTYLNRLFGARRMKVLERWKEFAKDERMINIISDEEVRSLSHDLFGKVL